MSWFKRQPQIDMATLEHIFNEPLDPLAMTQTPTEALMKLEAALRLALARVHDEVRTRVGSK